MHKFDVKYTFDNYYEYYKFTLIKQRIVKDLIFSLVFIALAIYWWVDTSETTANEILPFLSIVMGICFPVMNFITLPLLKKQLRAKQNEIDRTHIVVTFDDDEIIYENQTVVETTNVADENSNTDNANTEVIENNSSNTNNDDSNEVDNVNSNESDNNSDNVESDANEDNTNNNENEERIFKLKYNNFLSVKETKNLFLFYLDKQTVIILPKDRYVGSSTIEEFKNLITSKINIKRIKFLKEKVEK